MMQGSMGETHAYKMPRYLLWVVLALSVVPSVFTLLGIDFGARTPEAGPVIHTLFEWTGFSVGVFALLLAFLHYGLRGDVTIAIIGLALFGAGLLDALGALAAQGFIFQVQDNQAFTPIIWTVSRIFCAMVFIMGAAVFLLGDATNKPRERSRGKGFIAFISVAVVTGAVAAVYLAASSESLPTMVFANRWLHHPWDVVPLFLFLFAGVYVLPIFSKWHPSYFSHALLISIIPHVAAQLHMMLGSGVLYDSNFNIACALKVMAYFIPLHGLREDYRETYELQQEQNEALANQLLLYEQTTDALARDRILLQVLMDNLPEAIYVKDASLRYVKVNRVQASRLGLSDPLEAVGSKVTDLSRGGTGAAEQEKDREVVESGRAAAGSVPLRGPDGQVLGVVGISNGVRHPGTTKGGPEGRPTDDRTPGREEG